MDDEEKIAHWARSIDPRDAVYWHAEGDTWIGQRDDTGFPSRSTTTSRRIRLRPRRSSGSRRGRSFSRRACSTN